MIRNQWPIFATLLLLMGCANPDRQMLRTFKSIKLATEQQSEAYHYAHALCSQYGPRMSGTPGAAQSEEMASMLFRSFGYDDVYFQTVPFLQWNRLSADLTLDSAGITRPVPTLALAYSPSAQLSGWLQDVGNGLISDFQKYNVDGKIAVFTRDLLPGTPSNVVNRHYSEKISYAIAQGAIGCIIINSSPGLLCFTGSASLDGNVLKIPAVSISQEEGLRLRAQWQQGPIRASLRLENNLQQTTARNVVARLEGATWPNETIVVGAHLDSWDISEGALDNAAGAASVLDIARLFATLPLPCKRSLEFVLFTAEEEGCYGSKAYVDEIRRQNRLENIRYMMNMDMTINAIGFNLMGRYDSEDFFRHIGSLIATTDTLFHPEPTHELYLSSDHAAFLFEGIPTFTTDNAFGDYSIYHTPADSLGALTPNALRPNVSYAAMMLYALANASELPATAFSSEQVQQYLIDNDLQEALILSGDWIWN